MAFLDCTSTVLLYQTAIRGLPDEYSVHPMVILAGLLHLEIEFTCNNV
jgi:hypothetical protein